MTQLKTDEKLLKAIERAANRHPNATEIEVQRVSFIMGTLKSDSSMTRERVQEILARQEGKRP